ncbi:DUF192 domain-containing protein [Acuticoccus yangtzensis]|uniref:DUF192 domain-containing protein n=1 Tax=Acuticoccus yangtzensis TaxID=1443441 RepID=UPI000B332C67|nr:DUF192 domain-containing protein [Acuticoccus yangtzensis]
MRQLIRVAGALALAIAIGAGPSARTASAQNEAPASAAARAQDGAAAAPATAASPFAGALTPAGEIDVDALPSGQLAVRTSDETYLFSVEIADDPIERARGLMFREEMAADAGMLFIFAREDERAFWMQNTILPLDIIYADADGVVVSIAKDTTPYSTATIPSDGPAQFVLELNAGVSDAIGLAPGDRLIHRRIPE